MATDDLKEKLYLNKFKTRYRIFIDDENFRFISGRNKNIKIYPFDCDKKQLGILALNLSSNKKTYLKKTYLLKKIKPLLIKIHQECEIEFWAYFDEDKIHDVAECIKAKKKRIVSDACRERFIKMLSDKKDPDKMHRFSC